MFSRFLSWLIVYAFNCQLLQLVLANPVGNVMEKLFNSNALEAFGLDGLYLTVSEAVDDISSSWKPEKGPAQPLTI